MKRALAGSVCLVLCVGCTAQQAWRPVVDTYGSSNTVDAIMVFHQEGGAWKLWDEDVLGVQIP